MKQKKGLFFEEQEELVSKITAKRARGLPVTSLCCRITMRNSAHEFGDESGAKQLKPHVSGLNLLEKGGDLPFKKRLM